MQLRTGFDARWEQRDTEHTAGKVSGRVTEALKLGLGLGNWRWDMGKETRVGRHCLLHYIPGQITL